MPRPSDKRSKLIQAAQLLFHQRGIERTTLADVALASGVPLGNIYYYFKTKEELIVAVAESQRQSMSDTLEQIDRLSNPNRRLIKFVQCFDEFRDERAAHGCPFGNLCQEANKFGGSLAEQSAMVFQSITSWIETQFREMGCPPKRSKQNAVHILAVIQGASLAANTFRDPQVMRDELSRLQTWLRSEFESRGTTTKRNGKATRHRVRTLQV